MGPRGLGGGVVAVGKEEFFEIKSDFLGNGDIIVSSHVLYAACERGKKRLITPILVVKGETICFLLLQSARRHLRRL